MEEQQLNTEEQQLKELFKKFLKESLVITIKEEVSSSECHYSSTTYVELSIDGEVFSRHYINGLNQDR